MFLKSFTQSLNNPQHN